MQQLMLIRLWFPGISRRLHVDAKRTGTFRKDMNGT